MNKLQLIAIDVSFIDNVMIIDRALLDLLS
ncbi:MAG TPA: hypothetical protein TECP_00509 [Hyphomicrobiaceae bacterium MAG_BT-2024]